MGYFFSFEQPQISNDTYSLNSSEMSMMVEVMREVGAIREQGFAPNWSLLSAGVSQAKFRSNSNQLVTPEECLLIAQKLKTGLANGQAVGTLSFFDDAPWGQEAVNWIAAWADYNERAASAGGYRVN